MPTSYKNFEEINSVGQIAIGKSFGEIGNGAPINSGSKGGFGNYIEEHLFHYKPNSDKDPDFKEAGIELKVTPFLKNKNKTYSAKERLVLSIINFEEEYLNTFYKSQFWHKDHSLYMMFYEYIKGVSKEDLKIRYAMLYKYPDYDLEIIKKDWEFIINKIKNGKAHELSEADTMYLGACPKGKNSSSLRKQPFSTIMAMQRAYCLKQSYMTSVVRNHVVPQISEKLGSIEEIKTLSFEEIVKQKLDKYKGKNEIELISQFKLTNINAKNKFERITAALLGVKGKINQVDEFQKANIVVKTIRVQYNGKIEQSMSFPSFEFEKIYNETWENSELKEMLETTKFLFVVYKETKEDSKIFAYDRCVLWNMPLLDIESYVKPMWDKTKDVISTGNILTGKKDARGGRINNFPGISFNGVCHVRPHTANMSITNPLPVKDAVSGETEFTKQCFWLNNTYIKSIISKKKDI